MIINKLSFFAVIMRGTKRIVFLNFYSIFSWYYIFFIHPIAHCYYAFGYSLTSALLRKLLRVGVTTKSIK